MNTKTQTLPTPLRDVPYMGVIYVVAEAVKLGFVNGDPDWCNLGQGQPEVGELPGAPPRTLHVDTLPEDCAYGPLEGTAELRERIAEHYNRLYRRGRSSLYKASNVAVASGGRLALSRAMAALGETRVGYQLPDYTAYQDMLSLHLGRVQTAAIVGREAEGFAVGAQQLAEAVRDLHLGVYIFSNPCNPTGNLIAGDELAAIVALMRDSGTLLFSDEFYSHFIYSPGGPDGDTVPGSEPVSAAEYIEDVDSDPVLIFDGLTKSYRYPGWRVGWTLGPSDMIETMARTGSSLDGGPSRIAQRAALQVLETERADQETHALRENFNAKRNLMVRRLKSMGIRFAAEPTSTFYCWGSLENLPAPFNDGDEFFRRALQHKVMTVPGRFFDIDPAGSRTGPSPYQQWMRFSFGPPMENIQLGLDRLEAMLAG
jgi:aspartate/methionine/tyrosine aminotransferase